MAYHELPPEAFPEIERIQHYLDSYKEYLVVLNAVGNFEKGEIEIAMDIEKIYKIQEIMYDRYKKQRL